jgi:hypothetical protein
VFADVLGLDKDEAFQGYLQKAVSGRSALKRLIHRKGIAGYSPDVGRVLASFVTSNARRTSSNLHTGEIEASAAAIPKQSGQMADYARQMVDYALTPQEEAQSLRSVLFAQYIGGSIASALVNMTQPITMTVPYLSQHIGGSKAAAHVARAWKDLASGKTGDAALDKALEQAEEDGIVAPQEIHHLQAQAAGRGVLHGGDGTKLGEWRATGSLAFARANLVWVRLFGWAEQVNRRTTFIAAYRIAKEKPSLGDPVAFARDAINETQGIYNRGNRARFARGAVGATLMTFKQYSVAYVELLTRLAKSGKDGRRAALLMLALLVLTAGMDDLPFMEDLEDVVDGLAQRLGWNFSLKERRNAAIEAVVGKGMGRFLAKGISGVSGMPLDVSGRMGMGDLIPGTGLFMKKADHTRDVIGIAGPAGDLATRVATAAGQALGGEFGAAAKSVAPRAAANMAQSASMLQHGEYRDQAGRKVVETTPVEAALKFAGFQPNVVARDSEINYSVTRESAAIRLEKSEIAAAWAQGVVDKDPDAVRAARQRLKRWNARNPEAPISIKIPQIRQRIKHLRESRADRTIANAPKEIRARVKNDLEVER